MRGKKKKRHCKDSQWVLKQNKLKGGLEREKKTSTKKPYVTDSESCRCEVCLKSTLIFSYFCIRTWLPVNIQKLSPLLCYFFI